MKTKSSYCLNCMVMRSGLGYSLRTSSTSAELRANCSARTGELIPCTGTEAVLNAGLPSMSRNMKRLAAQNAHAARLNSFVLEFACGKVRSACGKLGKKPCGIARKIGQYKIGPGAADGGQRLHHHALRVQPAALHRGHDHAEFPGNLIGAQR